MGTCIVGAVDVHDRTLVVKAAVGRGEPEPISLARAGRLDYYPLVTGGARRRFPSQEGELEASVRPGTEVRL
ncbi:MAG: hypothetical protein ACYTFI_02185 [Planctomycetota bacterium]|jgi:hypothetical protein